MFWRLRYATTASPWAERGPTRLAWRRVPHRPRERAHLEPLPSAARRRAYAASGMYQQRRAVLAPAPAPALADEHAGAMYMTMTIVRPGLFFQREGPGSEPGNSLLCPDEASCSSVCGVLGIVQCRASLLHKHLNSLQIVRRRQAPVTPQTHNSSMHRYVGIARGQTSQARCLADSSVAHAAGRTRVEPPQDAQRPNGTRDRSARSVCPTYLQYIRPRRGSVDAIVVCHASERTSRPSQVVYYTHNLVLYLAHVCVCVCM